ncbi:thymidine phosphorylase [Candidatus Microgenomates bacterium]|nr:thymidine phosphorylase [Candidatus Microgenomates bacterium]MBI2622375.1 thymidine phosphorylase [Candidatus Microgenomates bacterium]
MQESQLALEAIRKKLLGKKLNYKEVYAVMDQIAKDRLGDILTTYFAASGYSKGFTNEEIYFLTRAMVETGEKLHFKGIVADKHSIGGMPGTRTTLIVVPIVAAAGFKIPKGSSRAITTPGGTADCMEVLANVEFSKKKIYKIVEKTNGCIVWGGSFNIAPADDEIIRVEEPLLFESYDKILISIIAKKVAFGSNHVVIDLPYGKTMKVRTLEDAEKLKSKFEYLAKKFKMKMRIFIYQTGEPAGRGIGPLLEVREAMRVLQRKENKALDLETRALNLAGGLLDLCLEDSPKSLVNKIRKNFSDGREWARTILEGGTAWTKMQQIIKAQGGNPNFDSENLRPAKFHRTITARHQSRVLEINNKNLTIIARILGAPTVKNAGLYLDKKIGDEVAKDEPLFSMYTNSLYNLKEAEDSLKTIPIYQ